MSDKIRFIGDVHGHFKRYRELIRGIPRSIQVGDLGIGFRRTQGPNVGEIYSNPPYYAMTQGDHRFIRGNHDNHAECRKHSQWIKDGHVENDMMFIGGAYSIDRQWRMEDYTWWSDEELSIQELDTLIDVYKATKPTVMVTHDCPEEVPYLILPTYYDAHGTRTRQALQAMFEMHKPELWIFGHWHTSFDKMLYGTRFICLNELEILDLEFIPKDI